MGVSSKVLTLSGRSQPTPVQSQSVMLPQEDLCHSLDVKLKRARDDEYTEYASEAKLLNKAYEEIQQIKKQVNVLEASKPSTKFEEVEPPFTEDILHAPLPPKFKMPQFNTYDGSGDPMEHLESYRSWMELHGVTSSIMCKGFAFTLPGPARK